MSNAFSLFVMPDATRWAVPVSQKRFTRPDTVDLFGRGELGTVPLNSVCQDKSERDARRCSTVNTRWTLKKTPLHIGRLKTADRLAWAGYNMAWPARAVVQSQRYCVFIINPVELFELQSAVNILRCITFRSSCALFEWGRGEHACSDFVWSDSLSFVGTSDGPALTRIVTRAVTNRA
jgi:hypothetical protein